MYQRPNAYEMRLQGLFNGITETEAHAIFNELALEAFVHQFEHNPVYKSWCELRGAHPSNVNTIEAIPFLPISIFKTKPVACFNVQNQLYFLSSQSSGEQASKHYIHEMAFYYRHLKRCFEYALGAVKSYNIIGLLPHYLERPHSSLIAMCRELMIQSGQQGNDFFINPDANFIKRLHQLQANGKPCIIFGVRFAFIEWAQHIDFGSNAILIETGGMKNRAPEMSREAFNVFALKHYKPAALYSEYGMTELFSQCYAQHKQHFICPPSLKIFARSAAHPEERFSANKSGPLDIIDLANIDTCCFIATEDVGTLYTPKHFEVLGRSDHSGNRGCHALWTQA